MEIRPQVFTITEFAINGRKTVSYHSKTGILILDLSQGDLEKLLRMVGNGLTDGVDITIPVPRFLKPTDEQMEAKGVRRIERFNQPGTPLLTMEYLMNGQRSSLNRY